MPNDVDYFAYHQSIADELQANQNRVRNLIGDAHWGEDGAHKEAVLRKALSTHIAQSYDIGNGFIAHSTEPSTQLDVLITKKSKPSLFQNGDIKIVTPDCVEAIVEVKTGQRSKGKLVDTLSKLADQVEKVRNFKRHFQYCWAGLFIYDGPNLGREESWSNKVLEALREASRGEVDRAINCVALGPRMFFRFWWPLGPIQTGEPHHICWHSYAFPHETHRGFAHTYFIGNLVLGLNPSLESTGTEYAWFPIRGRNGKEEYRLHRIRLDQNNVETFEY